MQRLRNELGRFWAWLNRRRRVAAQGLVEYALILVLISVVAIATMGPLGSQVAATFTQFVPSRKSPPRGMNNPRQSQMRL